MRPIRYARGFSCLYDRECSEGHTYTSGCLLRPAENRDPMWFRVLQPFLIKRRWLP